MNMPSLRSTDVFSNLVFAVDFAASSLSFKRKEEVRRRIVQNGGILSYMLTKKSDFLLTSNAERTLASYKGQTAVKYGIPVISLDYIDRCVTDMQLLDPGPFLLSETIEAKQFSSGKIVSKVQDAKKKSKGNAAPRLDNLNQIRVCSYKSCDGPAFPETHYEIAKYVVLKSELDASGNISKFCVLELHVVPPDVMCDGCRFRVFTHHGSLLTLKASQKDCRYMPTEKEAVAVFALLYDQYVKAPHMLTRSWNLLSPRIGSDKKRSMEEQFVSQEGTVLSREVRDLIDYIWNEATGSLSDVLSVPVNSLKLEEIEKAEGTLLSLKQALQIGDEERSQVKKLSDEFYSTVPHTNREALIDSKSLIAQKQDLCQLIKDVVSIGESTNWSTRDNIQSKYRSLKCHVHHLNQDNEEFGEIKNLVISSQTRPTNIEVLNIFTLDRPVEESNFTKEIENKKLLFHASKVSNYVGILSRGLLLPKIVVDDFGGKRSDPGMLGSGIYFANSASTSAKFSAPGSKGTRLMIVDEVALGNTKEYKTFTKELVCPPPGYQSTQGVKATETEPSDFKENEFVVYKSNQQRLRYLVEFTLLQDEVLVQDNMSLDSGFLEEETTFTDDISEVDLSDVMSVVDPLTKVAAGLKGTGDKPVPLQAVHIRARLLDLAAQVVVLQAYKNNSSVPIEAKYVFPLDDMAAVCEFEAFINGKHIIGEVKEKEQAHKEYREAISKGHGAYLMDEETPDVFTVNVGNLPPQASVLIKITYVAELTVEGEHICFSVPGSVAPWTRDKALDEVTQSDVDTVNVEEEGRDVSVQVAVEMPFEIRTIHSPTHAINIKRTSTKAVVELERGSRLAEGFQLLIGLAEIHVPRMWVERHDGKADSQACMLTFYPEFEADPTDEEEIILILDLSCSMKGAPLQDAKKLLLMCLSHMKETCLFNIVVFGDRHAELFPCSRRNGNESRREAVDFVTTLSASKGSTELWRVLHSLYLLRWTSTAGHPRNLFVISDGHVTEETSTLALIRENCQTNRVFTWGVGSAANRHLLRAMARVGGGSAEFFDNKVKSKWEKKVKSQLSKAAQPGLTSVSVAWQQHDDYAQPPVQAPHQIVSLFSGSRQVVYGFVDNCTQATLSAEIYGKVVSTMVSTSDLSITSGKILHQLTARAIIRDWDEGSLDSNRTHHEVVKRDRKDYIISLSKEHKLVTKFTSFVAVEHREKDEQFDANFGPTVEELVAKEEVDVLPYVGWEAKPEPDKSITETSPVERIRNLLEEGNILETSAVLQAERCFVEALKEARENGHDALGLKVLTALVRFYLEVTNDREKAEQLLESFFKDPELFGFGDDEKKLRELCTQYNIPAGSLAHTKDEDEEDYSNDEKYGLYEEEHNVYEWSSFDDDDEEEEEKEEEGGERREKERTNEEEETGEIEEELDGEEETNVEEETDEEEEEMEQQQKQQGGFRIRRPLNHTEESQESKEADETSLPAVLRRRRHKMVREKTIPQMKFKKIKNRLGLTTSSNSSSDSDTGPSSVSGGGEGAKSFGSSVTQPHSSGSIRRAKRLETMKIGSAFVDSVPLEKGSGFDYVTEQSQIGGGSLFSASVSLRKDIKKASSFGSATAQSQIGGGSLFGASVPPQKQLQLKKLSGSGFGSTTAQSQTFGGSLSGASVFRQDKPQVAQGFGFLGSVPAQSQNVGGSLFGTSFPHQDEPQVAQGFGFGSATAQPQIAGGSLFGTSFPRQDESQVSEGFGFGSATAPSQVSVGSTFGGSRKRLPPTIGSGQFSSVLPPPPQQPQFSGNAFGFGSGLETCVEGLAASSSQPQSFGGISGFVYAAPFPEKPNLLEEPLCALVASAQPQLTGATLESGSTGFTLADEEDTLASTFIGEKTLDEMDGSGVNERESCEMAPAPEPAPIVVHDLAPAPGKVYDSVPRPRPSPLQQDFYEIVPRRRLTILGPVSPVPLSTRGRAPPVSPSEVMDPSRITKPEEFYSNSLTQPPPPIRARRAAYKGRPVSPSEVMDPTRRTKPEGFLSDSLTPPPPPPKTPETPHAPPAKIMDPTTRTELKRLLAKSSIPLLQPFPRMMSCRMGRPASSVVPLPPRSPPTAAAEAHAAMILDSALLRRQERARVRSEWTTEADWITETILKLQSQDGYWDLSWKLSRRLGISFSKCRDIIILAGANSLGHHVCEQVFRLVATLLVLIFLKNYPAFDISLVVPGYKATSTTSAHALSRALTWIRNVEKKIPCLYSRLELGSNWEDAMCKLRLGCILSENRV